jgi:cytidylate kinase
MMAVITISRQYGSQGEAIALQLCHKLGYRYFDKELLAQAAAEAGLANSDVADLSEDNYEIRTFFDNLFVGHRSPEAIIRSEAWQRYVQGGQAQAQPHLDEAQSLALVRRAIQAAYQQGNVVIVGRGGQAILEAEPGVLHVRIEAPLGQRVQRIQTREKVDHRTAQDIINRHDRAAVAYLKPFYGLSPGDSWHYHLLINTGRWTVDQAVELIERAVSLL